MTSVRRSTSDSTICLKLWIFKLLSRDSGVCVEGYRTKDAEERELINWRSTAVVERLTSTALLTASGSKYILRGVIDSDSALALGYPLSIIELFKDGFPPDWRSILRKYQSSLTKANLLSATQWFNSTIIGFDATDNGRALGGASNSKRLSIFGSVLRQLDGEVGEGADGRRSRGSIGRRSSIATIANAHRVAGDRIEEEDEEEARERTSRESTLRGNDLGKENAESRERGLMDVKKETVDSEKRESEESCEKKRDKSLLKRRSERRSLGKDSDENEEEHLNTAGRKSLPNEEGSTPKRRSGRRSADQTMMAESGQSEQTRQAEMEQIDVELRHLGEPVEHEVDEHEVGVDEEELTEENLQESTSSSAVSQEKPRLDDSGLFKVPLLPPPNRVMPVVRLCNWTFRFSLRDQGASTLFPNYGIILEGFRKDIGGDWKSSCIVSVNDNRQLCSVSTVYQLEGTVNTILARQQGYPKEFIMRFLDGFPDDWHDVINDFYNTYIKEYALSSSRIPAPSLGALSPSKRFRPSTTTSRVEVPTAAAKEPQRGKDEAREEDEDADDATSDDDDDVDVMDAREQKTAAKSAAAVLSEARELPKKSANDARDVIGAKRQSARLSKKLSPIQRGRVERKSRGSPSAVQAKALPAAGKKQARVEGEVRVSRSGRVLKPPLASWAGQRILYNVRGSPVKALGIVTESTLSSTAASTSAIASQLGLSPPREPSQHDVSIRRSSGDTKSLGRPTCNGRRSSAPKRTTKLVEYSSSSSSDSSSDSASVVSDVSFGSPGLTPIRGTANKLSRTILSSPEEIATRLKKKKRSKKKREDARRKDKKAHKKGNKEAKTKKTAAVLKGKSTKKPAKGRPEKTTASEALSDVESNVSLTDFEDELEVDRDDDVEPRANRPELEVPMVAATKPAPPKKWKDEELKRLKLALGTIRPRDEKQWEQVAKSLGGGRGVDECRMMSDKKLHWKPPAESNEADEKEQLLKKMAGAVLNSKVGSVSYQLKAERFTRTYVMGASRGGDFFEETQADLNGTAHGSMMPSMAELDPNDSLLSVLKTPTSVDVRHAKRRDFQPSVVPLTPGSAARGEVDFGRLRSPSVGSAERDRQQRYVHKILRNNSYCSNKLASTSAWVESNAGRRHLGNPFGESSKVIDFDERDEDDEEEEEDEEKDEYFDDDDDDKE